MENASYQIIRNRNVAMIAVVLSALMWINGLRFFVMALRGWRVRPWHFLDAMGPYAGVGYVLICLFILGFAAGVVVSTYGKEQVLSACFGIALLLILLTRFCKGWLVVLVQYLSVASRTAMLVTALLILHDRWTLARTSEE